MTNDKSQTRVDRVRSQIFNHPWLAPLVVLGIIVIALGAATDAIDTIWTFVDTRLFGDKSIKKEELEVAATPKQDGTKPKTIDERFADSVSAIKAKNAASDDSLVLMLERPRADVVETIPSGSFVTEHGAEVFTYEWKQPYTHDGTDYTVDTSVKIWFGSDGRVVKATQLSYSSGWCKDNEAALRFRDWLVDSYQLSSTDDSSLEYLDKEVYTVFGAISHETEPKLWKARLEVSNFYSRDGYTCRFQLDISSLKADKH